MSGNLCLRGALRATAATTTSTTAAAAASCGSIITPTPTSRPSLVSAKAAQALRRNGAPGGPTVLACRRYASVSPASASASSPGPLSASALSSSVVAPADLPQTLSAEVVDSSVASKRDRERLERIVRKHLEHLSDPWKIAQYVQEALRKDRFDEALLLTQKASRDNSVVVSWNHLIDYQLGKDSIKTAVKLFNEMKKRGQLPNVQTFTIIFRGCARSRHPKLAIAEAMKHYNLLLSDARLQPNSTHLNAVLNVCARAGDLDSLFLAAESINDSSRAPTAYTYTTILNALRHHALLSAEDRELSDEERRAHAHKAIDRGKAIWTEVVDKWRRGRLLIDEELVCAMGRLLLLSRSRDEKRGILELLQQTMNIPNLTNTETSTTATTTSTSTATIGTTSTTTRSTTSPSASFIAFSPDDHQFPDPLTHDIAGPTPSPTVPISPPTSTPPSIYAIPGRNTLALICTILASAKLTTCGIKYWNLIVRHHRVVPDADNWLRLFGMLKVARASASAVSALALLPAAHLAPTSPLPFRIAMETCVRDNINPNAVANANAVLDTMLDRLPVPDLLTLRLYLRVALVSHYRLREKAQRGPAAAAAAKREYGAQIIAALDRLWEPYKRTHYHYFKASSAPSNNKSSNSNKSSTSNTPVLGELYNNQREVISLARHMFSAFNKVQNEHMLPDDHTRSLRPRYAKINREIQAFFSDRDELEPNIRKDRGTANARAEEVRADAGQRRRAGVREGAGEREKARVRVGVRETAGVRVGPREKAVARASARYGGRLPATRSDRRMQDKDEEDVRFPSVEEDWQDEDELGSHPAEARVKHGGDFIWNTTKPVEIITRRERRQKETEEWASSRKHNRDGDGPAARRDSRRRA